MKIRMTILKPRRRTRSSLGLGTAKELHLSHSSNTNANRFMTETETVPSFFRVQFRPLQTGCRYRGGGKEKEEKTEASMRCDESKWSGALNAPFRNATCVQHGVQFFMHTHINASFPYFTKNVSGVL